MEGNNLFKIPGKFLLSKRLDRIPSIRQMQTFRSNHYAQKARQWASPPPVQFPGLPKFQEFSR